MTDPGPSQSPNVDADWVRFGSLRLRYGFPDRRDPRIIPVGWICCKCQHNNTHFDAYGKPAEIEPGNTDRLKPCAEVNCRSRKRDHYGNELDPFPHSLCPECTLINHKDHPIMSGIGIPAALSDHIDRSKVAFWECCHCLKLNAINDSASGRCFSCHFQSQGSGHCRNPDHPRLQVKALSALRLAQRQYFYPLFVDPTGSNAEPPSANQHRQDPEEGNYLWDAYRKVSTETDVEIMLSAHVTCGDCRLLNGYKEYLIFADQTERRFVKGGVLWGGVNAKLLEWQQHNRRAPTPVEKAALLDEFEKHISKQFRKHANINVCWRTIERFKRYRAKKVVDKSSFLGNCDPNLYPECDMERTKRIMQRHARAKARFAMSHGQASVALMFRQKYRIMRDHGYFRDTRLVYEVGSSKHHRLNFQGKPSPLRQCFTRQVAETDHRVVTVGYLNRERARSTNTAEEDEVEAEAYQQRYGRRYAELLQQCEAAFQRILADLGQGEQDPHQASPSAP